MGWGLFLLIFIIDVVCLVVGNNRVNEQNLDLELTFICLKRTTKLYKWFDSLGGRNQSFYRDGLFRNHVIVLWKAVIFNRQI